MIALDMPEIVRYADFDNEGRMSIATPLNERPLSDAVSAIRLKCISQFPVSERGYVYPPSALVVSREDVVSGPVNYTDSSAFESISLPNQLTSLGFPSEIGISDDYLEETPSDLRPMAFQHRILFSEVEEIRISDLKQWQPTIILGDYDLEDE